MICPFYSISLLALVKFSKRGRGDKKIVHLVLKTLGIFETSVANPKNTAMPLKFGSYYKRSKFSNR